MPVEKKWKQLLVFLVQAYTGNYLQVFSMCFVVRRDYFFREEICGETRECRYFTLTCIWDSFTAHLHSFFFLV